MICICIGSALVDTIVSGVADLHAGIQERSIEADDVYMSPGGMALNVATNLSYLDSGKRRTWSSINLLARYAPNDALLHNHFAKYRIKELAIDRTTIEATGQCVCITHPSRRGGPDVFPRRYFYIRTSPDLALTPDDLLHVEEALATEEHEQAWVHYANVGGEGSYLSDVNISLMRRLRADKHIISGSTVANMDGIRSLRSKDGERFLHSLSWLCLNAGEAQVLTNPNNPLDIFADELELTDAQAFAHALQTRLGIRRVAVTCGEHGAAAFDGESEVALPAHAEIDRALGDPVGAGDAWMAGFIDAHANHKTLKEAVETANYLGARSLGRRGGSDPGVDRTHA